MSEKKKPSVFILNVIFIYLKCSFTLNQRIVSFVVGFYKSPVLSQFLMSAR